MTSNSSQEQGCEEPLLLWAVRESDTRRFVHIGMLTPSEKGAACRCLCKSCGEPLIAINVDKPASHFERRGTQRRHFKHRSTSSEQTRCASKLAKLLALQLFVEQGIVHLPERKRTVRQQLPNGHVIARDLVVNAESVAVLSKEWIDDSSFRLYLDGGRELIVTVRTHHAVDEDAQSTCVLSLAGIKDPAIASWGHEEILAHLRLPGIGMAWDRHWNDDQLAAAEGPLLSQDEEQILGGIPTELLKGLEGKQFNETILHWLIKKAIAKTGQLHVPEVSAQVHDTMPDGSEASERAHCPGTLLVLDDIRLERHFDNVVPDVMCRARRPDGSGESFDLMIEAAVTHYIDVVKRKKLMQIGIACIQIRADRFARAGSVPAIDIEAAVCADSTVKEWIVHPWIGKEIEQARKRLSRRARAMQRAIAEEVKRKEEKRERARNEEIRRKQKRDHTEQWIQTCEDQQLVQAYAKVLKALWSGKTDYETGDHPGVHDAVWGQLQARQLVPGGRLTLEGKHGLLYLLARIKGQAWNAIGSHAIGRFQSALEGYPPDSNNALLIMFALEKKLPVMPPAHAQEFSRLAAKLKEKIALEALPYQRRTEHDRLLSMLFPELAADIGLDFGTSTHYAALSVARERRDAAAKRRNGRMHLVKSGRQKQEAERNADAIRNAIGGVAGTLAWVDFPFGDPEPVNLYIRYNRGAGLKRLDVLECFKTVERYRRRGAPVEDALRALPFIDESEVPSVVQLLLVSKMCLERPRPT